MINDGELFHAAPVQMDEQVLAKARSLTWRCESRAETPPKECSWPVCGCDPYATKVLDALDEVPDWKVRAIRAECELEKARLWAETPEFPIEPNCTNTLFERACVRSCAKAEVLALLTEPTA